MPKTSRVCFLRNLLLVITTSSLNPRASDGQARDGQCGSCWSSDLQRVATSAMLQTHLHGSLVSTQAVTETDVDVEVQCGDLELVIPNTSCGRGQPACQGDSWCDVHPTDLWSVCCKKQANAKRYIEPSLLEKDTDAQLTSRWDFGFDSDGNAKLDLAELEEMFRFHGDGSDTAMANRLLRDTDLDQDGMLSRVEVLEKHDRERVAQNDARINEQTLCNGHAELCNKRFNEVAYATTHNSYNAQRTDIFWYANQFEDIITQLNDGIRGLMIDFHVNPSSNTVVLCHGGYQSTPAGSEVFCPLGQEPAADVLVAIRQWLELNPREVLAICVELYGSAKPTDTQVQSLLDETGMAGILYDPSVLGAAADSMWPTLAEMIEQGTRVVFIGSLARAFPKVHERESHWSRKSRTESGITVEDSNVTCSSACAELRNPDVPALKLDVHVLNNFISHPTSRYFALQMNFWEVLIARVQRWRLEHGRIPNLISVDFYEIGNVFQVVDALNGVAERPFRCRKTGYDEIFYSTENYCCPGSTGSACGNRGTCDKGSGQCVCDRKCERGFDCSIELGHCQLGPNSAGEGPNSADVAPERSLNKSAFEPTEEEALNQAAALDQVSGASSSSIAGRD